jgi:transposase-like protein
MPRRHYSDEERAAALAALKANGGNIARTAAQVGVPEQTLRQWRDNPDAAAPPQVREQKEEQLKDMIERVARESLEVMSEKSGEADYKDLAVGVGILIDKKRLLDGQPTSIAETRRLDLSRLTPHELDEFERLYNRAAVN